MIRRGISSKRGSKSSVNCFLLLNLYIVGGLIGSCMSVTTDPGKLKNSFVNEYGVSVSNLAEALDWSYIAEANRKSDGTLEDELFSVPGDMDDFKEEVLIIVTSY